MGKIILGLDLDGVLYDWHMALYTYYQYEMGFTGTYQEFWQEFINNFSRNKQEYLVSLPIPYEMIVPPCHVTNFLEFASNNSDIYYITSRHPDLERVTRRYLHRYNFPFQDNLFIADDKVTVCRFVGVTHFLDDHVEHVKAVNGVADVYLMAKPWNKEFQNDYKTVYNLREFREAVFQ